MRLRSRLIAAFVLATALPLAATLWIAASLLDRSLSYATTADLDRLSRTLEETARQFYLREREALRGDVQAARVSPAIYPLDAIEAWPDAVRGFWESGEPERFGVSGTAGDRVEYLRRVDGGVEVYTRALGGMRMQDLSEEFRHARARVGELATLDLRRGFTLALLVLIAAVWLLSLVPILVMAARISRPIEQLTAGLTRLAAGDWEHRIDTHRQDEAGRAIDAFNHMAGELQHQRDRLVYLTQVSSWQTLARKTAHELKNSLTPIRLTVEEMLARQPQADRAFLDQAAQIVIDEIETLERRVRAFSELGREPEATAETLDVNALAAERVSFLPPAFPATEYHLRLDPGGPLASAGRDLVKGILTNLLQNAAEAAGPGGRVLVVTRREPAQVLIEVHDSGPGLSEDARRTLFEPTITFKQHGMGLGLSIARTYALRAGGDLLHVPGELGGAAFRLLLPLASAPEAPVPQ